MTTLWVLKKLPPEQRPQMQNWAEDPWAFSVGRNHELVVRAPTELYARQLAESVAGMESANQQVWMNSAMTSCEPISWAGASEVISGVTKHWKHKNTRRKRKPSTGGYEPDKNSSKAF